MKIFSKLTLIILSIVNLSVACDEDDENDTDMSTRIKKYVSVQLTIDKMTHRFRSLEQHVSTLTARLREAQMEIDSLKRAQERVDSLTTRLTESEMEVDVLKRTAITSIRLGGLEQATLFLDFGFNDTNGYVITGIENINADMYPDITTRREMQTRQNGIWKSVPFI